MNNEDEEMPSDIFAKWWEAHCHATGTNEYCTRVAWAALRAFDREVEGMAVASELRGNPSDLGRLRAMNRLRIMLGLSRRKRSKQ